MVMKMVRVRRSEVVKLFLAIFGKFSQGMSHWEMEMSKFGGVYLFSYFPDN